MTRVEPALEHHKTWCKYCGENISARETARNTAEYASGVEMAAPFCSDACAKAYRAQERENIEEFEEVYRAGAT